MNKVEVFNGQLSLLKPTLLEEIKEIIAPSYINPTGLLKREDERCRTTYYVKNSQGQLITFFMLNFEKIENINCAYLGLSGVSNEYKNSGLASIVYSKFIEDGQIYQNKTSNKLTLYATTATPSAYHSISKLWKNLNPKINGQYDSSAEKIAKLYCKKYNIETKNHPFALKATAPDTLYSQQENERINYITTKNNFQLFNNLNICEREGDRLFMTFDLPENT